MLINLAKKLKQRNIGILITDHNVRETLKLVGHDDTFNYLQKLIINEKFPKVLLLSGDKGIGKLTLINHFMHFYFDKSNYDEKQNKLIKKSSFYNQKKYSKPKYCWNQCE